MPESLLLIIILLQVDGEVIADGTIYLWEQWSGASHYLAEYEGGYGTINIAGRGSPAYQWNDL